MCFTALRYSQFDSHMDGTLDNEFDFNKVAVFTHSIIICILCLLYISTIVQDLNKPLTLGITLLLCNLSQTVNVTDMNNMLNCVLLFWEGVLVHPYIFCMCKHHLHFSFESMNIWVIISFLYFQKLEDGSITVTEFLSHFGINFVIHRSRASALPDNVSGLALFVNHNMCQFLTHLSFFSVGLVKHAQWKIYSKRNTYTIPSREYMSKTVRTSQR